MNDDILCPAHKEIIKRVALGHVAVYVCDNGRSQLIGANRQLLEELRKMKLVSSFRKNPNCWQYVLTDLGRIELAKCFQFLEEETGRAVRTAYCKHCHKPFTPTGKHRRYCGMCGNPLSLSRLHAREKVMQDDEKHERKIACHVKWREWAKENDPDYYIRKKEAQARWRAKRKAGYGG